MPAPDGSPLSICSSGSPVTFYWRYCAEADHINAAVEALLSAICGTGRRWNPYRRASAEAKFRKRLRLAEAGELEPLDHVKSIDSPSPVDFFEIRWNDIGIDETFGSDGGHRFRDVLVRLYYAEDPQLGRVVVGLHCHEKKYVDGDKQQTRSCQDAEIDKAVGCYAEGLVHRWGLAEQLA